MQVTEVHEKDLGKGLDLRNAENQLEAGYWEDLLNAETDGKLVKKRKGYQQLGGYLPFRVQSVEWTEEELCFNLDTYVDLSRLRSSPIVVKGTNFDTVVPTGFPTDTLSTQYYPGFNVSIRRETDVGVTNPPTDIVNIPADAHGHNSWIQHANIYQSTSQSNLSNERIYGLHEINALTDLTTTGLGSTSITLNQDQVFIHASIGASVIGINHYYPNTAGVPDFETKTTDTWSFTPLDISTTDLLSSNLIVTVYKKIDSNTVEKVIPDDITLTGTVLDITIVNTGDGGADEYFYVATAVPDAQVLAGQISGSVQEVFLSNVDPFTSFAIYTLDGAVREYVLPDTAIYDDTTKELTITFQTNEALNYQIYYLKESLRVNQLCVDINSPVSTSTANIEMDLYGIDPLEVMEEENRNHWLTHIDTYRSSDLNQLVTGVAGNPYKLSSPGLETLYPRLELILKKSQYLNPLFVNNTQTFTSGFDVRAIKCDGGFAGPELTEIAHVSGSTVRFTLSCVSHTSVGFSGPDNDVLTVENAGYSIMNGDHIITAIDTSTPDIIYVDCTVDGVTDSTFDETDVGGYVQIYTSPLTIDTGIILDNSLIPGSKITIAGNEYTVRGNSFSSEERLYLSGVTVINELSSGLFILGTSTSDVVPMRTTTASVGEYVKGDMLLYTSFDHWIRIKDIIQLDTKAVTLSGNQVTLTGTEALNFQANQRIMIASEGLEGGVVTINEVVNSTTLEVDKTFLATSGRLIGKTFEIDESIEVSDTVDNSLAFKQTARWCSIEKVSVPLVSAALKTVQYPFSAFPTTSQRIIKSTMVSDNMYLTNGEDSLIKYDGLNISRAGLFRWEGATFVRKASEGATASDGAIAKDPNTATGTTTGSKVFNTTDALGFVVGQGVVSGGAGAPISTIITDVDVTNGKVRVADTLDPANTTLAGLSTLKYYFRLNIIDANNNIIGSAASGVDNNYTVDLTQDFTTVGMKLAKPPNLDLLDYSRLEYEVYRTKQDGAVFFKVATLQMNYADTLPYVYFEDTVADSLLIESDPVSTSTLGAELATGIDEPLRAKYITSANNRLVLGNLKDSHKTEVQIYRPTTELTPAQLDGLTFTFNTDINYQFTDDVGITATAIDTVGNLTLGGSVSGGNWVYLYKVLGSDGSPEPLGWFKTIGTDQIDYTGSAHTLTDVRIIEGTADTIPIFAGDEYTDGDAGYQVGANQSLIQIKLCNAIVATQASLDLALSTEGRTDGTEAGRFTIKSLKNQAFSLAITHTDLFTQSAVFINNTETVSGVAINSIEQNYSSRMLVSFQNFAEIFDRPRAIIPEDSLSVIDVNSADGQEITGLIPFFGDSTSQDSRKQDIVICFKENSIYAVNITSRSITKIDSRGVGCNAPNSITTIPNGIIFAAKSGVYRLNRSFDVVWVGRHLDRLWQENTNLDQLALATGHVYPKEQQYRLSVAAIGNEAATETYVYDYGDEGQGHVGGWTRFDNIPSTGWASDGTESYFASTKGRMYTIRNTGQDADYRDDDAAVVWSGTYRAMDFGSRRRKIVRAIISHFRVLKTDSGTTLEVGVDLTDEFTPTTSFVLLDSTDDGLSTYISSKVKAIRQNLPNQKGIYFQVKYSNSTIDTPVSLAGITFMVAGLDHRGITQASETT